MRAKGVRAAEAVIGEGGGIFNGFTPSGSRSDEPMGPGAVMCRPGIARRSQNAQRDPRVALAGVPP